MITVKGKQCFFNYQDGAKKDKKIKEQCERAGGSNFEDSIKKKEEKGWSLL